MGKIRAVCISREKGTPKENVGSGMLVEGFGLEGDAHGGNWHRQVSLLSGDKIDEFRKKIWVEYGALKKSGWNTERSARIWWWTAWIFGICRWAAGSAQETLYWK